MSALVGSIIQKEEEEETTCYICMEEASAANPFLKMAMCPCSGKADSTLQIHQLCLELSRDPTGKCNVCKGSLDGNWAFDETFARNTKGYGSATWTFTQLAAGEKHGAAYTLKRKEEGYYGPMRFLAEHYNYEAGKQHGPQIMYAENGVVLYETNCVQGMKHGRTVMRDDKGTITWSANYDDGQLHGLFQELYRGLQLGGTYEHDVKVGEHLEHDGEAMCRVSYAAGKKNGPMVVFHIQTGEGLPIGRTMYCDDLKHGLARNWHVDGDELTSVLGFEGNYVENKENGLHTYWSADGNKKSEIYYIMGAKHGVERLYDQDGKQTQENTYEMDVLHGIVRRFICGELIMDASYNRGFRHGVHVHYEGSRRFKCTWTSDGKQELLHGRFKCTKHNYTSLTGSYKMGVRHGVFTQYKAGVPYAQLRYRDGLLNGKCAIFSPSGDIMARGTMRNNVPVGNHVLYFEGGSVRESVCYDDEGQLHGTCTYNEFIVAALPFMPNRTKTRQILNFKHGVLHGRQTIDSLVFNMCDGRVHGRCIRHDERGVMTVRLIKEDEGVSLDEVLDGRIMCYPAHQIENSEYFADRFMATDGSIWNCKKALQGVKCSCDDCWFRSQSLCDQEEDTDTYCHCGMCRHTDYDSDDY